MRLPVEDTLPYKVLKLRLVAAELRAEFWARHSLPQSKSVGFWGAVAMGRSMKAMREVWLLQLELKEMRKE